MSSRARHPPVIPRVAPLIPRVARTVIPSVACTVIPSDVEGSPLLGSNEGEIPRLATLARDDSAGDELG
jgi:hypothetical protein